MSTSPVIACNLDAIGATERPRYNDLIRRLRAAVKDRHNTEDGYIFSVDGAAISLPEVAEWISMERLCCPFLTFQLSASGVQSDWSLQITGPAGAKAILDSEFPIR